MTSQRRTQQQRRAETQAAVLASAIHRFGEQGYADTSLDQIAGDCGLTIRPVYHYFGNKKKLFEAITTQLETELSEQLHQAAKEADGKNLLIRCWQTFLEVCQNRHFRQIVLIDAPNILGRQRWGETNVVQEVKHMLQVYFPDNPDSTSELMIRMLQGALAEAALMIAEADDVEQFSAQANDLVQKMFAFIDTNGN